MKKTDLGELDRKITIQVQATVRNQETGSHSKEWVEYVKQWAKVEYETAASGEKAEVAQVVATQRVKFTVRKYSNVTITPAANQILYNGGIYNILRVVEDTKRFRGMYLNITATVKDNNNA